VVKLIIQGKNTKKETQQKHEVQELQKVQFFGKNSVDIP
jgi:hypothetical protein